MGGEVLQWNESTVIISGDSYRAMRAGSWGVGGATILSASGRQVFFASTVENADAGFRVVDLAPVPEPLTILSAFLALGGLGGYVRRRLRNGPPGSLSEIGEQ